MAMHQEKMSKCYRSTGLHTATVATESQEKGDVYGAMTLWSLQDSI